MIEKYFKLLMLLLILSNLGYAQINTKNRQNYLSLKSLFPTSALEKEALFGIGIQKKYNQVGIEVEYGRIFFLWGFWDEAIYGGEVFEAKIRGNRIRLNLKYYLFEKSNNINTDFLGYLSLMPSFSKVKYNMSFWRYDSTGGMNTSQYSDSSYIPVRYNSTNLNLNILIGNEFFYNNRLNIDYYTGIGIKFYKINLPNDTPSYFQPFSKPNKSGNYLNFLLGVKVGYILNYNFIKKKRK
jgi:hypothetical protein